MTKKDYVITLLTKLSGIWSYADGLKLVVEQTDVQETVIDGLYNLLSQTVSETANTLKQESLQQGLTILQKIQQHEQQENLHIDEELDELLNQL